MKTYIGVDLGGTHVRVAKVDETGKVLQMVKGETGISNGVEYVIDNIVSMIKQIEGYENCVGVGMGVPGPVDTVEGKMVIAANLPGFEGYPIAKNISEKTGLPTFVDNDVNVACMGEAFHGAGRGKNIVYYITISTGIGGALVVDKKLVAGKNGHAGEVGNIIIDRNRERVGTLLNAGAVESEASGTAITRKGKAIFGDHIAHAGMVFDLARQGNEEALKLVDDMAYDLAVMFSVVAHITDPDVFVVGGGVTTKANDVFFEKMEKYFRGMIHKGMQTVEFKFAELEEPGIVGAAMLPAAYVK